MVVRITTDDGVIGWGETCSLGRAHLAAFFASEREALFILARAIMGLDPRQTGVVQAVMARAHARKSCSNNVLVFQLKVGDDPYEDAARVAALTEEVGPDRVVIADDNGGWNLQNELIAARAMAGCRVHLEQPCRSMSNCAEVLTCPAPTP